MPLAHRHGDARVCGATTVVTGQSTVTINGQLWAVEGDPNTHLEGGLIASGSTVTINGKKVIVNQPDQAVADTIGFPPHDNPMTAGSCASVSCY